MLNISLIGLGIMGSKYFRILKKNDNFNLIKILRKKNDNFNLIKKFKEKTNCPVIVNTSFNVRGEPIVNTPKDAFNCFMGTELDTLVVGNYYLIKKEQNPSLKKDYTNQFELD